MSKLNKMNKKGVRVMFWIVSILAGVLVLVLQIGRTAAETEKNLRTMRNESTSPLPVQAMEIVPSTWEQWKSYYGQVQSTKKQNVSSYIREIVDAVHVDVGDRVKKGQHLLTLHTDDHAVNVQASVAAYEDAKLYHSRLSGLSKGGGAARADVDKAYAAMKAAQADMQNAKTTLQRTKLYAKTSGVVTVRNVEPGEIAEPGASLLTIEDPGETEARLLVSRSDVGRISEKSPVRIRTTTGSCQGTVKRVTPKAQDGSGLYPVLVGIKSGSGMLPGTYIEGSFLTEKKDNVVTIPAKAVVTRGSERYVYIVTKKGGRDIVRLAAIDIEAGNEGSVLVGAGLKGGDMIVVSGARGLSDGSIVTYGAIADRQSSE